MKWRFKGHFSERLGRDYIYECDKCKIIIKVDDIFPERDNRGKLPVGILPCIPMTKKEEFCCDKCGELEIW